MRYALATYYDDPRPPEDRDFMDDRRHIILDGGSQLDRALSLLTDTLGDDGDREDIYPVAYRWAWLDAWCQYADKSGRNYEELFIEMIPATGDPIVHRTEAPIAPAYVTIDGIVTALLTGIDVSPDSPLWDIVLGEGLDDDSAGAFVPFAWALDIVSARIDEFQAAYMPETPIEDIERSLARIEEGTATPEDVHEPWALGTVRGVCRFGAYAIRAGLRGE